jgi:hypothetical protein
MYINYGCQLGCQTDIKGMSIGMSEFGCQYIGCLQDQMECSNACSIVS